MYNDLKRSMHDELLDVIQCACDRLSVKTTEVESCQQQIRGLEYDLRTAQEDLLHTQKQLEEARNKENNLHGHPATRTEDDSCALFISLFSPMEVANRIMNYYGADHCLRVIVGHFSVNFMYAIKTWKAVSGKSVKGAKDDVDRIRNEK